MKFFPFLGALAGVTFLGCAEKTVGTVSPPAKGWRSAGLEAPNRGAGDDQWQRLVSSGDRLIAMSTVGRMFASASYSNGWAEIPWGQIGTPFQFLVAGDSLWVGTESPGRLYVSAIGKWSWVPVTVPLPDSATIYGLDRIKNAIVLFAVKPMGRHVLLREGGGWVDWEAGFPLDGPYRTLSVGDTLFAATFESSTWMRVVGEPAWKRLPPVRHTGGTQDSLTHPRGLAWHGPGLWIADWRNEVALAASGTPPYVAYRNCLGGYANANGCNDLALNPLVLLPHRGRLFLSGHFPASGFVLDDSSGMWIPLAEGWCWNDLRDCGGLRTRDLVGLGDTLYAAGSRFIMKFPLSDVPVLTPELAASLSWSPDTRWRDSLRALPNPIR